MFSLTILLVFGVIINANGHLLKQLLHDMHEKFHPNHGHHTFLHNGPGRFPPFGPQNQYGPEYGSYGPPPFGFPPLYSPHQHSSHFGPHHHNCQHQPCHFPYPSNGQLPYPSFNPSINNPNTININNINANSQQDATSISSIPTDVNLNVIPTASNVPNYPTSINGHGSGVLTNSQSVHGGIQGDINYGQTQPLNPSIAVPNGYPINNNLNSNNNNNAYPSSTSQSNLGNNLDKLATLNGQANSLNAQTTNFNAQTTSLNAQTTNLNAQTTNFNGNSNNAMFGMTNQFGFDLNAFNAMNNLFSGEAANALSNNNVNNLNNNNNNNNIPQTVTRPPTVLSYTELPPVSSTTNRAGMEYDIDIRFGDNQKKTESKN